MTSCTGDQIWNSWTEQHQQAWSDEAPFVATWNEPGRMWWDVVYAMALTIQGNWESPLYEGYYLPPPVDWWHRDLEDVPGAGVYENCEGFGTLAGSWSTVNNASASGGSYKQSSASGTRSLYQLYYGRKAILMFKKGPDQGSLGVMNDYDAETQVSQYSASEIWKATHTLSNTKKGLHSVFFEAWGGVQVNIDRIEISNKTS